MFTLHGTVDGVAIAHDLREGRTTVGRTRACGLMLSALSVSRQHAEFRVEGGHCFVRDLGSRYGVHVDGVPVTAEVQLVPGNRIDLGEVSLTLEFSGDRGVRLEQDLQDAPQHQHTIVHQISDLARVETAPSVSAERLLDLLAEIGRTLVSVLPLPAMLERVVGLTFRVLPNERAFLLLRDPHDPSRMRATVTLCRDGSVPPQAAISRTIVGHVVQQRAAVVVDDITTDQRFSRAVSVLGSSVQSSMCAPLWNRAEVIGVLFVDCPGLRKFSRADLEVFTALANYAAVAIEQARMTEQLAQEARRRERLERYHSPSVVGRILGAGEEAHTKLLAEETDLTVLFCDIAGFTTVSEHLPPADTVSLLNGFFSRMCEVVFEFEGTLDKFIGDELMVVFNAPFRQPDHALRGARAALAMRRALDAFNASLPVIPLEVRIAVASGTGMVGDVGTLQRRDFTVLGDVVNTAARIRSTIAKPGEILVSEDTWQRLAGCLPGVHVGRVDLRGRLDPVDVYRLVPPPPI